MPWRSLRSKGGSLPLPSNFREAWKRRSSESQGHRKKMRKGISLTRRGWLGRLTVYVMSDYNHEGRKTKVQTWTSQCWSCGPTTCRCSSPSFPRLHTCTPRTPIPRATASWPLTPHQGGQGKPVHGEVWGGAAPRRKWVLPVDFHTEWTLERKRNALMKQEHRGRPGMLSGGALATTLGAEHDGNGIQGAIQLRNSWCTSLPSSPL